MDLKEERRLWKEGYKFVAGLDEAGRGCLAGPVVAGAVVLKSPKFRIPTQLKEINESKKLSSKKREEFYEILINYSLVDWGVGKVGPKVIDRINILEATKLAMKRAIKNLNYKLKNGSRKIDYLILDGNSKIDLSIPQRSIIKADEKVFSCAIASIIAKVKRDKTMKRYHRKFPRYGFSENKGYPTKEHLRMLKKYGPCKIHRKSFKPVRKVT